MRWRITSAIAALLATSCAGSEAFVGGGYLMLDGVGANYVDPWSGMPAPAFTSEGLDDVPFFFAGVSFPIGPSSAPAATTTYASTPPPLRPYVEPTGGLSTEATGQLSPDEAGRISIPGIGDFELVAPSGDPWAVAAMALFVVAASVAAFIWYRRKRKKA